MKKSEYTEKSDVFSYGTFYYSYLSHSLYLRYSSFFFFKNKGIICWELLTGQEPYSEYPVAQGPFKTPLEEAIIKGLRPTIPPNTPTLFQSLIKDCWSPNPLDRPSFNVIVDRLKKLLRS